MLYHTARFVEECDIKYITQGPQARVQYISHTNRDEVEDSMSVYTTRLREYLMLSYPEVVENHPR